MDRLGVLFTRAGRLWSLRRAVRIVVAVSAASCLSVGTARAVSGDESARLYQLIDNGKLETADRETSNLLSDNPGDPVLLFMQALIAEKSGDTDQAISLYRQLTLSHPSLLEPYNNLAIQLASKGDMKAAIAALERAMQVDPAVAIAYRNLTAIYAQMASASYRKALNSSAPLSPLELATIDKIQTAGTDARERPELVASVETFVNESIADTTPEPVEPVATPAPPETRPEPVVAAATPAPKPEPEPTKQPVAEVAVEEPVPTVSEIKVATTQPAAVRPSDQAREAAEQGARDKQALINHIKSWAAAWSDRDVDRYLGHYSSNFQPRNGLSLAEWKKQRYGRLRWREFIVVEPSNYNIDLDNDEATVNFTQYYKSDRLEDTIRKTLKFSKEGNQWHIVRELI